MTISLKTIAVVLCAALISTHAIAADDLEARVNALEKKLDRVVRELVTVRDERDELRKQQRTLVKKIETITSSSHHVAEGAVEHHKEHGLEIESYGEHHFTFNQGDSALGSEDMSDIHRFVVELEYKFADWIEFEGEVEFEHGFVEDGVGGGKIVLEEFKFEFEFDPRVELIIGRTYHPAGIINSKHKPTAFYSVERPTFATNILPSTWSIDGIGLKGDLTDWFAYKGFVHAGLQGSEFSEGTGIRGGRQKERPGLGDPGFSGRIDVKPLVAMGGEFDTKWRVGGAFSHIGAKNANRGRDITEVDSSVSIYALDTDIKWNRFDFRGEYAFLNVSNARGLNQTYGKDVSENIFGWYLEGAYHLVPDGFGDGKFEKSDLVTFLRYGVSNTQESTPGGGAPDKSDNLEELTIGLAFYPLHDLVLKADYTFVDSETGTEAYKIGLGIGYEF